MKPAAKLWKKKLIILNLKTQFKIVNNVTAKPETIQIILKNY